VETKDVFAGDLVRWLHPTAVRTWMRRRRECCGQAVAASARGWGAARVCTLVACVRNERRARTELAGGNATGGALGNAQGGLDECAGGCTVCAMNACADGAGWIHAGCVW
jgi:hypothetical protein